MLKKRMQQYFVPLLLLKIHAGEMLSLVFERVSFNSMHLITRKAAIPIALPEKQIRPKSEY